MRHQMNVRVTPETAARYRELAMTRGTTVHALARNAIELYAADGADSAFIELDHDILRAVRNRFGDAYRARVSSLLRFYLYDV
jgi:predicted transcriptional regulator